MWEFSLISDKCWNEEKMEIKLRENRNFRYSGWSHRVTFKESTQLLIQQLNEIYIWLDWAEQGWIWKHNWGDFGVIGGWSIFDVQAFSVFNGEWFVWKGQERWEKWEGDMGKERGEFVETKSWEACAKGWGKNEEDFRLSFHARSQLDLSVHFGW